MVEGWIGRLGPRGPYVALAVTCLLAWAFKGHCGAFWSNGIQYTSGCYSDVVPFWTGRGVANGQIPYIAARMEYPVLTGMLIWFDGTITRLLIPHADASDFLFVVTAVNAAFAFGVLRLFEHAGMSRVRLYAWAAAPSLLLYLGHNWDMLAVAFAIAATLCARRDDLRGATMLAALGSAAKLFPVLLLPLLGLDALFGRGRGTAMQRVVSAAILVGIAVISWGAVNLPFAIRAFTNWSEFYTFSSERSGTAASIWELLSVFGWWQSDIPARNLASFALFAIGAAIIVTLGWRRHSERPWLLMTPLVAWFLLTNKVYSPQFDLWLWPLLVMTSRRLWPLIWFAIGDVLAYFAEFWWFAGMEGHSPSTTPGMIAAAAAFRGGVMLWIIAAAVREPAPDWIATPPRADFPPPRDRPTPIG